MSALRLPTNEQRRLDADFEAIFGSGPALPPIAPPLSPEQAMEAEQAQVRA